MRVNIHLDQPYQDDAIAWKGVFPERRDSSFVKARSSKYPVPIEADKFPHIVNL